jgi:hypothetical protein
MVRKDLPAMENDEVVNLGMSLEELRERFPLVRKDPDDPGARIRSLFFIENPVLDFLACTRAAGVEPTCTEDRRIRGHVLPSGKPNVLPALWEVAVVKEPSWEIDSCVASLLDLVHPRVEQISQLLSTHRYRAGFLTNVTVFEEEPFYGLSSSTLRRLADFGLEWSLDVL